MADHRTVRGDVGVSVVLPMRNGSPWVDRVIDAILQDAGVRPVELVAIDDGDGQDTAYLKRRYSRDPRVRVLKGDQLGAAAALNLGITAARFDLIAQIDQDVQVQPGWMATLVNAMTSPDVAAAQGCYVPDPRTGVCARVMALDLGQRYARHGGGDTDHVCTGNTMYRREVLVQIGGFDPTMGYGYDNDVSYRLVQSGHRLVICPAARSTHQWREGLFGYLVQQYGFGYGRLDLVWRHPRKLSGDAVSPARMMAHPALLLLALVLWLISAAGLVPAAPRTAVELSAILVIAGLVVERGSAGIAAARSHRDVAGLMFPVLHLLRDAAWLVAIGVWLTRRFAGSPFRPHHSMKPRPASKTGDHRLGYRDVGTTAADDFPSRSVQGSVR